jgi:hypothetical protein
VNRSDADIKDLLNSTVDARLGPQRPAPPFNPGQARKRRSRKLSSWTAPLLAAAAVVVVSGGTFLFAGHGSGHRSGPALAPPATVLPSMSPSPSGTPSPTGSTESSAPATTTTPAQPTSASTAVDAKAVTFDGVGNLKLGMTRSQLEAAGYTGSPTTDGCVSFQAASGVVITLAPGQDAVVAISTLNDPTYQTVEGIRVGSSFAQLQSGYRGHVIETKMDRSFGQGSSGVLVQGEGGWIGFTISNGMVSGLKVGDHGHATNAEVGC